MNMMINTIETVISSTLLHLYGQVESIKRSTGYKHVTTAKRDAICVAYLKSQLKLRKNQKVKNKIKKIISAKRKIPIEHYLVELNATSYDIEKSDIDSLYSLLEILEKEGVNTFMIEEVSMFEVGCIYIAREDICECFDEFNHQISPLPIYVKSESSGIVGTIIQEKNLGKLLVSEEKEDVYLLSLGDR